jgi:acyl carrier protein
MDRTEIMNDIKEIIIKSMNLQKEPSEIIGQDLINEIGINSIDALEIFVWIENKFEIQIADEDLSDELLNSLDSLADYIIKKKA